MQYIVFKTDREGLEWKTLDPRMQGLLLAMSQWQFEKWAIPVTVTCINRTPEQNGAIPGSNNQSAHMMRPHQLYFRAVDIRNKDLTPQQQRERREYVLFHWNKGGQMIHFLDHNSGAGDHTHININYGYMI